MAGKVGVKFCGNCNPHIDTAALLREVMRRAEGVTFVGWDGGDYTVLLVLSACDRDCATRPPFTGPLVVVTSETVDRWPMAEAALPEAILAALRLCGVGG